MPVKVACYGGGSSSRGATNEVFSQIHYNVIRVHSNSCWAEGETVQNRYPMMVYVLPYVRQTNQFGTYRGETSTVLQWALQKSTVPRRRRWFMLWERKWDSVSLLHKTNIIHGVLSVYLPAAKHACPYIGFMYLVDFNIWVKLKCRQVIKGHRPFLKALLPEIPLGSQIHESLLFRFNPFKMIGFSHLYYWPVPGWLLRLPGYAYGKDLCR